MILFGMAAFGWFVSLVALAGQYARSVALLVTILETVICAVSWSGRPKCPELEPTRHRLARRAWITSGLYLGVVIAYVIYWAL
jgi:hypothetical protein